MSAEKSYSLRFVISHLLSFLVNSDWIVRLRLVASLLLTLIMIGFRLTIPFLFKMIIELLSKPDPSLAPLFITLALMGYGACWMLDYVVTQLRYDRKLWMKV